jgi:trehalose 6-phosphate synthase
MWSAKTVNELIESKLKDFSIVTISNREPYIAMHTNEEITHKGPGAFGGMAVALDSAMQACKGLWIAWGSGDADKENVDKFDHVKVPPENPKYTLRRVWIGEKDILGFYFGASNQTLWPLCHPMTHVRPEFKPKFWRTYKKINRLYAKTCLEEIKRKKKVIVFLQDYHLTLCPKFIREKRKDVFLAHFWHIPWPPPEVFSICPWKKEILEGLLSNDLLGFHISDYCKNFLATVKKELKAKVNHKKSLVEYKGHKTWVKPFPISIDFKLLDKTSRSGEVEREIGGIKTAFPYKFLGIGVDRIDYTKGIPERLKAIDRFLEKYPEYQKHFIFFQAATISRIVVPAYKRINEEIDLLVSTINQKYKSGHWKPIIYLKEKIPLPRLIGLHKRADMAIVSPLQDGMNIVGKEYVAAQSNLNGVLLLSPFAGAGKELKQALLVNPRNIEKFADTIKKALEMPKEEKKKRMQALRKVVKENNIYKWVGDIFSEISKLV